MKSLALLLVLATCSYGSVLPQNAVFGNQIKESIAKAKVLREVEEQYLAQRIVGGVPAALGQYPYQAGIISDIVGITHGNGICGGSLISPSRIATAAHCWFDGINQAWRFTVVLGSITIFNGGTRLQTSVVITHPNWTPALARNDVAVIYLTNPVSLSSTIAPIALPEGSELHEDFVSEQAIASGFGLTQDGGGVSPVLNHVRLLVISNNSCRYTFPLILQETNICTSGFGTVGVCGGDSGGPLVVVRGNRRFMIGITSFGSVAGCESNLPSAYARVTSFENFLRQHQD